MSEDSSAAVLIALMRLEQTVTSKLYEIEARLVALEQRLITSDASGSANADVACKGVELQIELVRAEARRDTALVLQAIRESRDR